MSELHCKNSECTVAQTGTCMLSMSLDACPHYVLDSDDDLDSALDINEPLLESPSEAPRFPPSVALSVDEAQKAIKGSYGHVIGILGAPDSGKTACLVSLYLLLSHGRLDGFSFASSQSLRAFDDLSRGARSWQNGVPEQLTAHTQMIEGRAAGFLHLKLVRELDGKKVTLLIPDLPGEWTTSFIDNNEVERLGFLKSAQSLWLMVDGRSLIEPLKRRNAIHRTRLLIQRVVSAFHPSTPNLHLVISRCDLGLPAANTVSEIQKYANTQGVSLDIRYIASFSKDSETEPGYGISELILESLKAQRLASEFWPNMSQRENASRNILRISE